MNPSTGEVTEDEPGEIGDLQTPACLGGEGAQPPLQKGVESAAPWRPLSVYAFVEQLLRSVPRKVRHFKGAVENKGCLCFCGLEFSLKCVRAVASRRWGRPRGGSFSADSGNSKPLHKANFPH